MHLCASYPRMIVIMIASRSVQGFAIGEVTMQDNTTSSYTDPAPGKAPGRRQPGVSSREETPMRAGRHYPRKRQFSQSEKFRHEISDKKRHEFAKLSEKSFIPGGSWIFRPMVPKNISIFSIIYYTVTPHRAIWCHNSVFRLYVFLFSFFFFLFLFSFFFLFFREEIKEREK